MIRDYNIAKEYIYKSSFTKKSKCYTNPVSKYSQNRGTLDDLKK